MSNCDLPARASPSEHANNMAVTMLLGGDWDGQRERGRPATRKGSASVGVGPAGKVRNLLEK